jgi:hypothetical protein
LAIREIFGISRGIDAQGALLLEQDGVIKPWMVVKFPYAVPNKMGSISLPCFIFAGVPARPRDWRSWS